MIRKGQELYKRPDWFGVVEVSRALDEGKGRRSYVCWQEVRASTVVVELLSRFEYIEYYHTMAEPNS